VRSGHPLRDWCVTRLPPCPPSLSFPIDSFSLPPLTSLAMVCASSYHTCMTLDVVPASMDVPASASPHTYHMQFTRHTSITCNSHATRTHTCARDVTCACDTHASPHAQDACHAHDMHSHAHDMQAPQPSRTCMTFCPSARSFSTPLTNLFSSLDLRL